MLHWDLLRAEETYRVYLFVRIFTPVEEWTNLAE